MLEKGKKVGEYVLLEKLGAGGFGEVWKAEKRTELSTSHFALKFFRPKDDAAIDLESVKKEIQTWQSLSGLPNVISVIEANRFEDYVFIVSEYASGGSLEKWLKERGGKASSPEEAVAITRQILQGLEAMHGAGFVHRDLKPANVLIKKGFFCLADFGISRRMKTQSKTSSTAGTYEFMPPEAFEKTPSVTVQTDIWAVGAILQQLLTGRLPFPQEEIPSLITAILMGEPEPLPESVPPALREIIGKALQKNREDRFRSAREMREALRNARVLPTGDDAQKTLIYDNQSTIVQEINPLTKDAEAESGQLSVEEVTRERESDHQLFSVRKGRPKTVWVAAAALFVSLLLGLTGLIVWYQSLDSPNKSANDPANTASVSDTAQSLKNSFGMEFVRIPAGEFLMGSPKSEKGRDIYEVQHRVTISKDFYLGKYEVTQAQWRAMIGNDPSFYAECGADCPVENVSWDDVQEFIKKLNAKGEGIYRLPTEAEWEYACRAGTTGSYSGTGILDEMGWYIKNSGEHTQPVGQKRANAFGLYDMHGNVHEWTADWYAGEFSTESAADPKGASSGSYRVFRGGGWGSISDGARSAFRGYYAPSEHDSYLGFRLVRVDITAGKP